MLYSPFDDIIPRELKKHKKEKEEEKKSQSKATKWVLRIFSPETLVFEFELQTEV